MAPGECAKQESSAGVLSRFAGSVRQRDLAEQTRNVPGHRSHGRDVAPRDDNEHKGRTCAVATARGAMLRLDGAQNSSTVNQTLGAAGFTIDSFEVKLKVVLGKTARVLGSLYCLSRVRIHGDTCLDFCMHAM